ncbi:Prolyl-tRNA synthetase associated domain-containing protein 1, partial [Linum perenne]
QAYNTSSPHSNEIPSGCCVLLLLQLSSPASEWRLLILLLTSELLSSFPRRLVRRSPLTAVERCACLSAAELSTLKELEIKFEQYEHPAVLTVDAQAKYVGDKGGGLSKNLFLKDKKSRFYIVSALADTKVDLKVLSQRLGLGKGGIRMAPEEALGQILQVSLGCVTPFALVNESARDVSLLLDKGFKSQEHCFFHPLSNETSISLRASDLDKFLESIGREPSYVDLEANPSVGKDQPPDLANLVPSGTIDIPDAPSVPSQVREKPLSVEKKSTPSAVKASKPSSTEQNAKDKSSNTGTQPNAFAQTDRFVEEMLNKTSELMLSEISTLTGDVAKQEAIIGSIRKRLSPDLQNLTVMFKNTAYTQGFYAGSNRQPKRL